MSAIETYLQYIASKVLARDVRTAIVNAIRQCYDDVHNPTLNTEAMQAAVQAKIDAGQMAGLTIGDGTLTGAKFADGTIPKVKLDPNISFDADAEFDTTSTNAIQNGVVARAIGDVKADLEALEPGLSQPARAAILECFRHVIWADDSENYYGTLYNALTSGSDPTRPITINVPQVGTRTTDGFVALNSLSRDHRGIVVSGNTSASHKIMYYNETQEIYDTESPYYPVPIPVGAQHYWFDGAIENRYAYSAHICKWNDVTGEWERIQAGQFIWVDALADPSTPASELAPYKQDISHFNDGTYYMVIGIAKSNGRTGWSDNAEVKKTFPNGAYLAQLDTSAQGVVNSSIKNLALRFDF